MRLVECLDCRTENTLDSRFCRSCGGRLPEDEVMNLKAENAKLIGDARMMFSDFRTDECRMMVESVLAVDPKDWDAKALLADCLEREGRPHDAIELYEEVVAARPDSAIDRVRLQHLNKVVSASELAVAPTDNRKTAVLAGVAAVLMLGSVGAAMILAASPGSPDTLKNDGLLASQEPEAEAFRTIPLVPTYAPQPQSNPATDSAADGTTEQLNGETLPTQQPSGHVRVVNPNRGGMTSSQSTINDPGLQPLEVQPPAGATVVPNSGTSTSTSATQTKDPDPTSQINPRSGTKTGDDVKPDTNSNPGIIEIEVKSGSNGNSDSGEGARSAEALIRKARDLYAQGDYSRAVKTYEDALRAGASTGATNQRIAQCYEKLGNRSAAISAYQRAVASYEASMKSGGGSRTQAALDVCKQAIKNLGG